MESNARLCGQHPTRFQMILMDGTPGPCFPSWANSAKPASMKGKFCLPLFWEIVKSYGNDQWYYFLSLKWWPKGANFLLETKYHLLRSLYTSTSPSAQARVLFDQFDGGSENRNFPNIALAVEMVERGVIEEFNLSRLVTGHSHNEGDAAIKAPRAACENTACLCLGDIVRAMLSASHGKKPVVVIVRDIHDWTARANTCKNPHLKHLGSPHLWKCTRSSPPGVMYKDSYTATEWLGADGIPNGRPVEVFATGATYPENPPVLVSRFSNPFSVSAVASTKSAIRALRSKPKTVEQLASVLSSGGSDSSLGLCYTRQYSRGTLGFPGTLTTSDGSLVPVRVLSGLPTPMWDWQTSTPTAAPPSVEYKSEKVVTDRPPRRARASEWKCPSCSKIYKRGRDSKRAIEHRVGCPVLGSPDSNSSNSNDSDSDMNSMTDDEKDADANATNSGNSNDSDSDMNSMTDDTDDEKAANANAKDTDAKDADGGDLCGAARAPSVSAAPSSKRVCKREVEETMEKVFDAKADNTDLLLRAQWMLDGDYCGICKEELFDTSRAYECTQSRCNRVFHSVCLLTRFGHITEYMKVDKSQEKESKWNCPVCRKICAQCEPATFIKGRGALGRFYRCCVCKAETHKFHFEEVDSSERLCYYCENVL